MLNACDALKLGLGRPGASGGSARLVCENARLRKEMTDEPTNKKMNEMKNRQSCCASVEEACEAVNAEHDRTKPPDIILFMRSCRFVP